MTYASRTATVILTGLLAIASTCGRAAGQGGTRWIRWRPWLWRARWTLGGEVFFSALLRSFDWTLDRTPFRSYFWTSRPRSQFRSAHKSASKALECYSVADLRPSGVTPSAEKSVHFPASQRFLPPAPNFRLCRMSLRMVRFSFPLRRQLELSQRCLLLRSILLRLVFRTDSLRLSIWQHNMV